MNDDPVQEFGILVILNPKIVGWVEQSETQRRSLPEIHQLFPIRSCRIKRVDSEGDSPSYSLFVRFTHLIDRDPLPTISCRSDLQVATLED